MFIAAGKESSATTEVGVSIRGFAVTWDTCVVYYLRWSVCITAGKESSTSTEAGASIRGFAVTWDTCVVYYLPLAVVAPERPSTEGDAPARGAESITRVDTYLAQLESIFSNSASDKVLNPKPAPY